MKVTVVFIGAVLVALIPGVPAPAGHQSKFCKTCHNAPSYDACVTLEACHAGACMTEVHDLNGVLSFTMGCKGHHECEQPHLIGRAGHHGQVVCRQCCLTTGCEQNQCASYYASAVATTPPMTSVNIATSTCVDHESDSFNCSDYDKYDLCHDTNSIAYSLAHDKCQKHCGFCDCFNVESDTFKCVDLDKFNFCTDPNSVAYALSHEKCKKHCGLCGPAPPATTTVLSPTKATMTMAPDTQPPQPVQTTTAIMPPTPTTTQAPVTATAAPVVQTTEAATTTEELTAVPTTSPLPTTMMETTTTQPMITNTASAAPMKTTDVSMIASTTNLPMTTTTTDVPMTTTTTTNVPVTTTTELPMTTTRTMITSSTGVPATAVGQGSTTMEKPLYPSAQTTTTNGPTTTTGGSVVIIGGRSIDQN
ncbi:mucin-5AC-like [Mya arenaria]|uniref:mucin-5AC-like n=1 Tax=Mya arenaria TaxID=6604 RepID=UPI0022E90D4C|nr:mucin-5AC-like [Mya arenaria]